MASNISESHPEALCPFQVALVGVIQFKKSANFPVAVNFKFFRDVGTPFSFNQARLKQIELVISAICIALEVVMGNIKYPPDKKWPGFLRS